MTAIHRSCRNQVLCRGRYRAFFLGLPVQSRVTEEQDEDAPGLFREYLNVFLDLTQKTTPLSGASLDQAENDFEKYLKTVVDHDPGVKGYKVLFGKESGVAGLWIYFLTADRLLKKISCS